MILYPPGSLTHGFIIPQSGQLPSPPAQCGKEHQPAERHQ
jgi:hypothetical protein